MRNAVPGKAVLGRPSTGQSGVGQPSAGQFGRALLALLALLLGALAGTGPALAHGGGKPQLTGAPAGPYRLYTWTSPEPWRVGLAHTTVAVTLAAADGQETPVSGAQVAVVYTRADGSTERVTAVEGTGASVGFYEGDAPLDVAGTWTVQVEVAGPAGSGAASFSEAVLAADAFNWWLVGAGVLAVLLVLGYLGTRKGGPRRRAASQPGQSRPGQSMPGQQPAAAPADQQRVQ